MPDDDRTPEPEHASDQGGHVRPDPGAPPATPSAAPGPPAAPTAPYGSPAQPWSGPAVPPPAPQGPPPAAPYGPPAGGGTTAGQPAYGTGAGGYGTPAQPGYTPPGQPGYAAPGQPGYAGASAGYASAPGYGAGPAAGAPAQSGPYAAGPGAPSGPQAYGATPYGAPVYGAPYPGPAPRTDGVSIAALVTGILFLGIVPLVLGILGLRRVKRSGAQGRGFAIAGIVLGGLEILAQIGIVIAIVAGVTAYNNHIDGLRADCAAGDMAACDRLYDDSTPGSDEEDFGATCGGRTDGYGSCSSLDPATGTSGTEGQDTADEPYAYGDDPALDALWDACAGGDAQACDDLFMSSPSDSEYEQFGETCGGTTDGEEFCAARQDT